MGGGGDFNRIKAILFDSGHTLNRPKTWHWFVTPKFYEFVDKNLLKTDSKIFKDAIAKGNAYLNSNHHVKTEEEEFEQFKEFYSIVLNQCKYISVDDNIIDGLARDCVYNDDKFVFFDDVEQSLTHLKDKYMLGVVSDTWPSLERVFKNKGIRHYFSTFVMSSVHGMSKSNTKLFELALEELKVSANEAVFVDDSYRNLIVASKLGIIPVQILRYSSNQSVFLKLYSKVAFYLKTRKKLYQISSLIELERLLSTK